MKIFQQHLYGIAVFIAISQLQESIATSTTDDLLINAGCKKKVYGGQSGLWDPMEQKHYHWIASGKLLERGVCLEDGYRSWVIPVKGNTKVLAP